VKRSPITHISSCSDDRVPLLGGQEINVSRVVISWQWSWLIAWYAIVVNVLNDSLKEDPEVTKGGGGVLIIVGHSGVVRDLNIRASKGVDIEKKLGPSRGVVPIAAPQGENSNAMRSLLVGHVGLLNLAPALSFSIRRGDC